MGPGGGLCWVEIHKKHMVSFERNDRSKFRLIAFPKPQKPRFLDILNQIQSDGKAIDSAMQYDSQMEPLPCQENLSVVQSEASAVVPSSERTTAADAAGCKGWGFPQIGVPPNHAL